MKAERRNMRPGAREFDPPAQVRKEEAGPLTPESILERLNSAASGTGSYPGERKVLPDRSQELDYLKALLAVSGRMIPEAERTYQASRELFFRLRLRNPGLVNLTDRDNPLFTGWYYSVAGSSSGQRIMVTGRVSKAINGVSQSRNDPYAVISPEQAQVFSARMRQLSPLSGREVGVLNDLPGMDHHHGLHALLGLTAVEILQRSAEAAKQFREGVKAHKDKGVEVLGEFSRDSLYRMALLRAARRNKHTSMALELKKMMVHTGNSLLQLDESAYLAAFRYRSGIGTIVLPFPKDTPAENRAEFGKYFEYDEPLTRDELKVVFKHFIDPQSLAFPEDLREGDRYQIIS